MESTVHKHKVNYIKYIVFMEVYKYKCNPNAFIYHDKIKNVINILYIIL